MPPRRKSKVSTPAPTAALNISSEIGHSAVSNKSSTSSFPGSKSRLAPSIPFQMTTRRGAKTTSNHTSPAAPSSASSGSRRSSLNDITLDEDALSDAEHARPAKRSRTSSRSGSSQMSNGSFHDHHPVNGTQSPDLPKPALGATLAAPKPAPKRRRASDESTQSSKTLSARQNGVLTRAHSDVSEQQPRKKKRKTTEMPADPADQPPELTDASTAPNSPEQLLDVDGSQSLQNLLPTNGDAPAKAGRRLPGRRRQPHSDINVEIDLRRQLNLKMSYRSLAKVQKAILEELSSRSTDNLEKDPNFHVQCPEYEPLMASLDSRRDSRLDQVNALRMYRLEQLERVRIAEETIHREQYINRFQELQDDFLLQCYIRMIRLEREAKGQEADATDDEDNIVPPTYTDEPHYDVDDRIGSKYASRSRAYVEAEKVLQNELVRRQFDRARTVFVEQDADADDSIEDASGGFARFKGPDRTEAIMHHNINSLAEAVLEVERTPSPLPEVPKPPVISNEEASLLMMLAELSTQPSHAPGIQNLQYIEQQAQQAPPPTPKRRTTPAIKEELIKQMSPMYDAPEAPSFTPSQGAHVSPIKASQSTTSQPQEASRPEPNGFGFAREAENTKSTKPPRPSTHRIMDILNDDQEVLVSRTREPQPPAQEPNTPSRRSNISQHNTPSQNALRVDAIVHKEDRPVDQALMDALGGSLPPPSELPTSPHSNSQPWQRQSIGSSSEPENALRRRDPIQRLRDFLDKKQREHGREAPDRTQSEYWTKPEYIRYRDFPSRNENDQERSGAVQYDPTRPSAGLYSAPPSNAPAYPGALRRESQDQGPPHWEHDRRMSTSQVPQQPAASPYQANPPQPYQGELNKHATSPQMHHSSYAPPPPAGTLPLPPKPSVPPPSAPINFRFAHYDPAPPRSFPPPSTSYPPASHAPPGPPQSQYSPSYAAPPVYQSNYVPPPGSFQAPPPPSTLPSLPPLKIHQYGGQPILPANMAPPSQSGPSMTFVGQSATSPAFSPTQSQPSGPHYEQREGQGERPPEPQSRPRRQYRSYHAPGTQFRSYQGPAETRRRGG